MKEWELDFQDSNSGSVVKSIDMKNTIKSWFCRIPFIRELERFKDSFFKMSAHPPGHYYSPIVNQDEILNRDSLWPKDIPLSISGIELNSNSQLGILSEIQKFYESQPFSDERTIEVRYYFNNGLYSYTDAIFLHGMIRYKQPKRIIEVGSGFSSAVMLDVNELFFDNTIGLTFIEPYPLRLKNLVRESDYQSVEIIEDFVQNVPLDRFSSLEEGDFLFIDSSHVSKTGSDLNHLLFNVLPVLKEGVFIHFHDIFYPFEYPESWVMKGFNWNENYMLRSFLAHNRSYKICLFADYLAKCYSEEFRKMPLCLKNTGGNIWLEKVSSN